MNTDEQRYYLFSEFYRLERYYFWGSAVAMVGNQAMPGLDAVCTPNG